MSAEKRWPLSDIGPGSLFSCIGAILWLAFILTVVAFQNFGIELFERFSLLWALLALVGVVFLARLEWEWRKSELAVTRNLGTVGTQMIVTRAWPLVLMVSTLAVVSLIAAILPIGNYDFYRVLRWLVFVAASALAVVHLRLVRTGSAIPISAVPLLILIAMLWNPIWPLHLTRAMWAALDLAAALYLTSCAFRTDVVVKTLVCSQPRVSTP